VSGWALVGVMIRKSRSAPPSDLTSFYALEYPRVLSSLRWYVGDDGLAEEIAQETFTRLCERWETVSVMASPGAWVHRVAMNQAKSGFRRRASRRRKRHLVSGPDLAESHDETAAPLVHAALRGLSAELRAVVVLRFCADLSVRETAEVLRIAEGTVKTRTRAAVSEMRAGGLSREMEYVDD